MAVSVSPRSGARSMERKNPGASLVDDDQRSLASCGDGVWCSSGNHENLAGLNANSLAGYLQLHLAFDHEQGFDKVMHFIWIRGGIHAQDLDVGSSHMAEHFGSPRKRKGVGFL